MVTESNLLVRTQNYGPAFELAQKLVASSAQIRFASGLGDSYLLRALCFERTNQLDSARKNLFRSYGFYKVAGNMHGAGEAIDGMSEVDYITGDA